MAQTLDFKIDTGIQQFKSILEGMDNFIHTFDTQHLVTAKGVGANLVFQRLNDVSVRAHENLRETISEVEKLQKNFKKMREEYEGTFLSKAKDFTSGKNLQFPLFMAWIGYKAISLAIYAAKWTFNKFVGLGGIATETWRSSLGTGSTWSGTRLLGMTASYATVHPETILNNVAIGRYNLASDQAMALRVLKVKRSENTNEMAYAAIFATIDWARNQPEDQLDYLSDLYGITSIMGNHFAIHSLRNLLPKDEEELKKLYNDNKDRISLDKDGAAKWFVFTTQLDINTKVIQTALQSKLTKLSEIIGQISDALLNRFVEFMESDLSKDLLLKVSTNIDSFFKQEDFLNNLKSILDSFNVFLGWIKKLTDHQYFVSFVNSLSVGFSVIGGTAGEFINRVLKATGNFLIPSANASEIGPNKTPKTSSGSFPTDFTSPEPIGEALGTIEDSEKAKAYLHSLSTHPDRTGDTDYLNPQWAIMLAKGIALLRAHGYDARLMSGARDPSVAPSGWGGAHPYGLAADIQIGGKDYFDYDIPEVDALLRSVGMKQPFRYPREWNHWQIIPPLSSYKGVSSILAEDRRSGNIKKMWQDEKKYLGIPELKMKIDAAPMPPDVITSKQDKSKNDSTLRAKQRDDFSSFPAIHNFTGNNVECYSSRPGILHQ